VGKAFVFYGKISEPDTQISTSTFYLCAVPGDQLLQNLPRAEMQQGYVVVAVCPAYLKNVVNSINVANVTNVVNAFDSLLGDALTTFVLNSPH